MVGVGIGCGGGWRGDWVYVDDRAEYIYGVRRCDLRNACVMLV